MTVNRISDRHSNFLTSSFGPDGLESEKKHEPTIHFFQMRVHRRKVPVLFESSIGYTFLTNLDGSSGLSLTWCAIATFVNQVCELMVNGNEKMNLTIYFRGLVHQLKYLSSLITGPTKVELSVIFVHGNLIFLAWAVGS